MTCTAVDNCFFILTFGRLRQFLASPLNCNNANEQHCVKNARCAFIFILDTGLLVCYPAQPEKGASP